MGELSGSEVVDLVDDRDEVVGSARLGECLNAGLLHRAVAVLVLRSSGAFLLQRRSESDIWNPGLWTISCTGHVKRGESYPRAALRELREELGLISNLDLRFKMKLPLVTDRSLTENEWVSFFTTVTDATVTPDPTELAGVQEFSRADTRGLIREGPLTADARIILRRYLEAPAGPG